MNKIAKYIIILLYLPFSFAVPTFFSIADDNEYIEFLDSAFEQAVNNNIPAALVLLDDIIRLYPNSIQALKMRSQLLWLQARRDESLSDIDNILSIQPYNQEFLLTRCFLLESMGKENNVIIPCYLSVAQKIKDSSTPESLSSNIYYALASILSQDDNAESIKKQFIENDNNRIEDKQYIINFDRDKLKQNYCIYRSFRLNEKFE